MPHYFSSTYANISGVILESPLSLTTYTQYVRQFVVSNFKIYSKSKYFALPMIKIDSQDYSSLPANSYTCIFVH